MQVLLQKLLKAIDDYTYIDSEINNCSPDYNVCSMCGAKQGIKKMPIGQWVTKEDFPHLEDCPYVIAKEIEESEDTNA